MAVHLFTGPLGNGKTLSAVQKFFDWAWLKGGYVFTNVSVNWEACKKHAREVHGVELQDRQLVLLTGAQTEEFHKHVQRGTTEVPALLCIDEAGKYFNSKAWNKMLDVKMKLSDMLRESRKLCLEVIFIVQNEERLDKSFRELMEFLWRFRSLKWIPVLRRFTIQTQLHADTEIQVTRSWWWRDARLFKCYDTLALYSDWDCATVPQLEPVQFPKKPKKPASMLTRICLMVGLVYFCWTAINTITTKLNLGKIVAPAKTGKAEPAKLAAAPVQAEPPHAPGPVSVPVQAAPVAPVVQQGPAVPQILVEPFRGSVEGLFLRTQEGDYRPGQYCAHGRVIRLEGNRVAHIVTPQGGQIVLVARDWDDPGKVSARDEWVRAFNAEMAARASATSPVVNASEMPSQARAQGGYPAQNAAERIARARAGVAQDAADIPAVTSNLSSGILPAFRASAPSLGAISSQ